MKAKIVDLSESDYVRYLTGKFTTTSFLLVGIVAGLLFVGMADLSSDPQGMTLAGYVLIVEMIFLVGLHYLAEAVVQVKHQDEAFAYHGKELAGNDHIRLVTDKKISLPLMMISALIGIFLLLIGFLDAGEEILLITGGVFLGQAAIAAGLYYLGWSLLKRKYNQA